MGKKLFIISVMVIGLWLTGQAWADLASEFTGYTTTTWEVAVSGLKSSYHGDTQAGQPISGATVGNSLQTLGPNRVFYPYVGSVPSPGGAIGQHFDQGVLGVEVQGNQLTVGFAGSLNPYDGYYYSGWQTWYSQGDVFLTVQDTLGVRHFALLNAWPRDGLGVARVLDGGHFDSAQAFHLSGGAGGTNLEGHLVALGSDSDVTLAGGRGSYNVVNAPDGLDLRIFAQGGTDLGEAQLNHSSTSDYGLPGVMQDWYLQTWTLDLTDLSSDSSFMIGLHSTASCGNDSIGLVAEVSPIPAPGAAILGWLGLGFVGWLKRRYA